MSDDQAVPGAQYAPDCAVYEMTLRCNLSCIHCGATAGHVRRDELSLAEIEPVAIDLKRVGFKRVSLIGGEPFLRKDWFEVASIFKQHGLVLTFVSNGWLLADDDALAQRLLSLSPQVIGFSLDGGTAATHDRIRGKPGSFDRVWRAVERLRGQGANLSLITTVNRLNIDELPLIRDLILGKGIGWQIQIASINGERFDRELFVDRDQYLRVARFVHECVVNHPVGELPIGGADDLGYYSKLYPRCSVNGYGWQGCKGGILNLGIQSNGDVKGCLSLPERFIEGNVRQRRLFEIWNDPQAFAYSRHFDPEQLLGACRDCLFGERCKGGCPDIASSICGHPFENTYCLYLNKV